MKMITQYFIDYNNNEFAAIQKRFEKFIEKEILKLKHKHSELSDSDVFLIIEDAIKSKMKMFR